MAGEEAAERFEATLARLEGSFAQAFEDAEGEQALREAAARFVGPQGELTKLLRSMREVPAERRRALGQAANRLKQTITAAFEARLRALREAARQRELSGPRLDVTLPGRRPPAGRVHPLRRVTDELLDVFVALGFEVADGPEVELHEANFDRLGFPPDHPATDMQDSFFVRTEGARPGWTLLRTHTSTIQVRQMLQRRPPLALVAPGAVYRRDDDATHSPMFFQLEGLLVDEEVSFAHLRGVLQRFVARFFGEDVPIRLRPSYFPFVEPGGEVDIGCTFCRPWEGGAARSEGCRPCSGTGWLEVLGCGMVHPVVFEHVGYDPERWTGFAFGLGIDRIAMLRYGVPNIRLLYENDVRFLEGL